MATPVLVNGYTGVSATAINVREQDVKLFGYSIWNASNATAFVQFYDAPRGAETPTVGTTVSKWATALLTLTPQVYFFPFPDGLYFRGGLWVVATTTINGSSAPSAALTVSLVIS